ncbi:WD40 repeat-like protein [Imleria badia]|nr:WD40 repeat-like protein [Imleria badia]
MDLESDYSEIFTIAFHPDEKHFYGGTRDGIRRWRVADGQEVGKQMGMDLNAISVSRDHKWIVCGTTEGASVWDAELQEKVVEVEGTAFVGAVDISPDSTRFATGTGTRASIWSILTGERLVGPLEHGRDVKGIKFSLDGGRIATACKSDPSIHIFDSHNGDQLITIENLQLPQRTAITPIVWAPDGQLFATSEGGKMKSFDPFTGSQLAEWELRNDTDFMSIALSANKFIACSAGRSVSFWDTSTYTQLGIVEDPHNIRSIALSPDGGHLVTGGYEGSETITIWDLSAILPETYLPLKWSSPSVVASSMSIPLVFRPKLTKVSQDSERPQGAPELETGSRDDDDALLEVELPQKASVPLFNYEEPPSPLAKSRENPLEPGALPPDSSQGEPHTPPGPPMNTTVKVPDVQPNPGNAKGNRRPNIGGWFKTMMGGSHKRTLHQTSSEESPQTSTPPSNEKPSTITHGKRVQRTVGRSTARPQKKAAQKPVALTQPPKATPRSEAGPAIVPDETKVESSGAQDDAEVGVHFVRSEVEVHTNSYSESLRDHHCII